MHIRILTIAAVGSLFFASCKEQLVNINTEVKGWDTTYVSSVPTPQEKKILVEEMSGITCVNCPDGIVQLNGYNSEGPFKDKLIIVGIHTGAYTTPITKGEHKSKYDFRTEEGAMIVSGILGQPEGKPAAGFDRLPIGSNPAPSNILDSKSKWATMLAKAGEKTATPVNINIESKYIADKNYYDVGVKVTFTETVTQPLNLNVYVIENGIVDVQQYPTYYDPEYVHNHVFRTCLTPYNGQIILSDMATKEPGRVFEQHFVFKIKSDDAKQQYWKPENMEIVAFVSKAGNAADKGVLHTTIAHLD